MNKLLEEALYKISEIDDALQLLQENLCNPKCSDAERLTFNKSINVLLDKRLIQMQIRNENK